MNQLLYARETGEISGRQFAANITNDLLRSFELYPHLYFDGSFNIPLNSPPTSKLSSKTQARDFEAHYGGVNSLTVDKFYGRYLATGGSEGSVKIWDLEMCKDFTTEFTFRPKTAISRVRPDYRRYGHTSGVTHIEFHSRDENIIHTSSYDETLKQWDIERDKASASFDLRVPINTFAASPIVSPDNLIACAMETPQIRLVDTRTASTSRAMTSHGGGVFSLAWSPIKERILCSGHEDGTVKIWDSRRFSHPVAMLDQEDTLGVMHHFTHASLSGVPWTKARHFRSSARAHDDTVNGLAWTDDGNYIVSAGLDRHVRVWNAATGANTLVGFETSFQNYEALNISLIVSPGRLSYMSREVLYIPNGSEVAALELRTGKAISQLRVPGNTTVRRARNSRTVKAIAWRGSQGHGRPLGSAIGGANTYGAIYAAYGDGKIRAFMPNMPVVEDVDLDPTTKEQETKKRKRKAVDDAYRRLMGTQMRFT
ncbi:hypothetical protein Cpir12675_001754 [Ceratocystis pirilliformis]|uniref:DNA excision repair protein ERCC-8 n=1 Tax=Ceratocystis pirilliformis TaxID=259994 RepID=A0ABR3ZFB3_9PEZI